MPHYFGLAAPFLSRFQSARRLRFWLKIKIAPNMNGSESTTPRFPAR